MSSSTFSTARRNLVAICQLTSQHDLAENLRVCSEMVERAKARDCKMVFFPECFDYIGRDRAETIALAMEEHSDYISKFRELARQNNMWLSLGGFHHKDTKNKLLPFNTHLIINQDGETSGSYQKLHLFDLDIPGKVRLMESEFSEQGTELKSPVETPVGKVGICAVPRAVIVEQVQGAEILTFPSSFTVNTGLAHWEALLRARAIETQCYVVAAAQTGKHNDKRSSYGHAMAVDPWGAVIAQCSETVDMCFAEINLDYVKQIRTMQPVFGHRRADLYSLIFNEKSKVCQSLDFGGHIIPAETIFYQSGLSFAFVNLKPIVPGHVLIAPIRKVERLTQMTDQETADFFVVAKKVQKGLEGHFKAPAFAVTVQDGLESGQSVKHVHAHIVPRFENDPLGDELHQHLQGHEDKRKARPIEEMVTEASTYRSLFQ
uniref:Nitrilase and fragile histidine triad fusion protein NitFhit n=1 Tax=Ditylenchus dipsaci TaxID=166011 RepID=A0A915CP40_9BILA